MNNAEIEAMEHELLTQIEHLEGMLQQLVALKRVIDQAKRDKTKEKLTVISAEDPD